MVHDVMSSARKAIELIVPIFLRVICRQLVGNNVDFVGAGAGVGVGVSVGVGGDCCSFASPCSFGQATI